MNYIWDMAIKAARQGIRSADITFLPSGSYSPYMELAFEYINTANLALPLTVEVNPYYRFCDIFQQLLDINFSGHESLRAVLFDLLVHFLLTMDCRQGLCKREYYAQFILKDIESGVFGQEIKENMSAFTKEEREFLLSSMIALYRTHASLHLFKKVVRTLFCGSIIYYRSEDTPEMLIYLGVVESDLNRRKIDTLLTLFLPMGFAFRLYWENHFGIIGQDATMGMNHIVIY
jgi:hypothetical protein